MAAAQAADEQLRRDTAEVPRLRNEVARWREQARELAQLKATGQTTKDAFTQYLLIHGCPRRGALQPAGKDAG